MQSLQKEQVTMPILPEREDLQPITVDVARAVRRPGCSDYSYAGSTAYTVRMTCRTCGHSTTARRNENFTHTPDNCPHTITDKRESSKTTSRTYRRQCGSFIDETTMQFHKERVAIGKRIEKAPRGVVEAAASFTSPRKACSTYPGSWW